MAKTSDTEKTSQESVRRNRRFLWRAASIVVLLALGVWAIRLSHKPSLFSPAPAVWFLPLGLAIVALMSGWLQRAGKVQIIIGEQKSNQLSRSVRIAIAKHSPVSMRETEPSS